MAGNFHTNTRLFKRLRTLISLSNMCIVKEKETRRRERKKLTHLHLVRLFWNLYRNDDNHYDNDEREREKGKVSKDDLFLLNWLVIH